VSLVEGREVIAVGDVVAEIVAHVESFPMALWASLIWDDDGHSLDPAPTIAVAADLRSVAYGPDMNGEFLWEKSQCASAKSF
jgi:hypothetical protein